MPDSLKNALGEQVRNAYPNMWSREKMKEFLPVYNETADMYYQEDNALRRLRELEAERRLSKAGAGVRAVKNKKHIVIGWAWVKYEPVEPKRAEPSRQEMLFETSKYHRG